MGRNGWKPTSHSIVVSSIINRNVGQIQISEWDYENGYFCGEMGSYHRLIFNVMILDVKSRQLK